MPIHLPNLLTPFMLVAIAITISGCLAEPKATVTVLRGDLESYVGRQDFLSDRAQGLFEAVGCAQTGNALLREYVDFQATPFTDGKVGGRSRSEILFDLVQLMVLNDLKVRRTLDGENRNELVSFASVALRSNLAATADQGRTNLLRSIFNAYAVPHYDIHPSEQRYETCVSFTRGVCLSRLQVQNAKRQTFDTLYEIGAKNDNSFTCS